MNSENKTKLIQGRLFFLTISSLPKTDKTLIVDILMSKEKYLERYLISEEIHSNPEDPSLIYHYHIFLSYKSRNKYSINHWDYLFNKHGNYQAVRNISACITYILKDDNILANFNWKELLLKYNYLESIVKYYIKEGYSYEDIFKLNESQSIKYWSKVKNFIKERDNIYKDKIIYNNNLLNLKKLNKKYILNTNNLKDPLNKSYIITKSLMDKYKSILNILEDIFKYGSNRPCKSELIYYKHLLIISTRPSTGKSKLAKLIEDNLPTFNFPFDNWFNGYQNNIFKAIIWNECSFVGYQPTFLNRFLEGSKTDLPIKGSKAIKEDNPLIIMTSNFNIYELLMDKYKEKYRYDEMRKYSFELSDKGCRYFNTLKERITEIILEKDENLFPLITSLEKYFNKIKHSK